MVTTVILEIIMAGMPVQIQEQIDDDNCTPFGAMELM